MQYSLTCPAQGCNFSVKVNTQNSEWALEKIIELSSFHNKQSHPDLPRITHEQIKNIVLSRAQEEMEYDQ
jgi:hypothetical protein